MQNHLASHPLSQPMLQLVNLGGHWIFKPIGSDGPRETLKGALADADAFKMENPQEVVEQPCGAPMGSPA